MNRTTKKLVALVLSLVMVLSVCPLNAFAAPQKNTTSTVTSEQDPVSYDFGSGAYDFSAVNESILLMGAENVEIDEEDPAIMAMEEDLDNIVVAEEGAPTPVPLTEEQKGAILAMYQQYLDQWEANADILGVQTPFFLSYNDNNDELGVLGEMLALANIPLDYVRAGYVSYDDITGMIMNFMYGDKLGIQYYGNQIETARKNALQAIKDSGAKTEEQKLLVLNEWLAHNCTFDMPYIMNNGKAEDEKPMVAETPVKHERYDDVYKVLYDAYEEQIRATFEQQIRDGFEANLRQQVYEQVIWNIVYQGAYEQYLAQSNPSTPPSDDTTQEPSDDTTQEPSDDTTQEPSDDTTQEPSDDTTQEPSDDTTQEPSDDTTQEPADGTTQEPADGTTQEPADEVETAAEGDVNPEADAFAKEQADKFMADNADAIAEDAVGFAEVAFEGVVLDENGTTVPQLMVAQAEATIEEAKTTGVEVDPVNAPGYKMTTDQIVAQQMDTPMEDLDGMTPNEAIPVYADQAALGLTDGILNYWEGHHIGALGTGTAVCFGYAKAFTYLVQSMHPEIYGTNGANTDMSVPANWKDAKDLYYNEAGELDINQGYLVDMVRITFDASITMFGETQDNFNSDHFWNAVKVDGKWYYVDPCYMDVFIEVMNRDRAETDGAMNHLYYLFSHTTALELYDGYFAEGGIKTLYADAATSQIYEDSWFSRIASNAYSDGANFYYVYDSTDLIQLMRDSEGMNADEEELDNPPEIKLVYHPITATESLKDGDNDYTTLIDFNHRDEVADTEPEDVPPVARVYNPETNALEENEFLTKLIRQHEEEEKAYPSINITTALYNGKLYFNLSNTICSYDLGTGEVELVKEYNKVYAKRDKTNPFGGMAFTVVNDASKADLMVENSPIAAMTIKEDGKMYVSVATNYAFISGKDPHNSADQGSYGYEFEETNFNPRYNSFMDYSEYGDMIDSMEYEMETNDNDEFMWTTNFVETLNMSHVAGDNHKFEEVSVDAHCGRNAYTENRCTTCGISEAETREEIEDSAYGHHYLRHEETYYTKDDNGNWNTGVCYVCTECKKALEVEKDAEVADEIAQLEEELEENDHIGGHEYVGVVTKWERDYSAATMDVMCVRCVDANIDVLQGDNTIELAEGVKSESVETERITITNTAEDGTTTNEYYYDYTAVATVKDANGKEITVKSVPAERVERPEDKYDTIPFVDVPKDPEVYFVDPVIWAVENGITTGTTETTFEPDKVCTRAEAVTFLYRVAGQPKVEATENPFKDVSANEYYYNAVLWAVEEGITTGYNETTFAPDDVCSRAQIVTFIWRMQGEKEPAATQNPFADVPADAYYCDAVLWAVEEGITTGYNETTFGPDDDCSRAHIVTFLYREFAK